MSAATGVFTRQEIVDLLREEGHRISDRLLLDWQRKGIIPYGVRGWRDGRPTVLYSEDQARALEKVVKYREQGLGFELIRYLLQETA